MSTTSTLKRHTRAASKLLFAFAVFCLRASAAPNNASLPDAVISAKSIHIVNKTGNQAVLARANDDFAKWGRFTVVNSDDADLIAVFTNKNGIGISGEVGFTEMDVFPKGASNPVFQTKSAFRTIFDMQHRTTACIGEFRKRLEQRP